MGRRLDRHDFTSQEWEYADLDQCNIMTIFRGSFDDFPPVMLICSRVLMTF